MLFLMLTGLICICLVRAKQDKTNQLIKVAKKKMEDRIARLGNDGGQQFISSGVPMQGIPMQNGAPVGAGQFSQTAVVVPNNIVAPHPHDDGREVSAFQMDSAAKMNQIDV